MQEQSPNASRHSAIPPLFGPADDTHFNACMPSLHYWDKWSAYIRGYKLAADLLVKLILEGRTDAVLDTLIIPIVFNYRQYIELTLKLLHIQLSMLNGKRYKVPRSHNLEKLWAQVREELKIVKVTRPSESFDIITDALSQFTRYDSESFSFRYPVDTKGKLVLDDIRHINVRQLHAAIQAVDDAFDTLSFQVEYVMDSRLGNL